MLTEHARHIVDQLADAGYEAEVRDDYSGRYMYGVTTTGVVFDAPTTIALIGWAAGSIPGFDASEVERFRTDDMGLGTIVY